MSYRRWKREERLTSTALRRLRSQVSDGADILLGSFDTFVNLTLEKFRHVEDEEEEEREPKLRFDARLSPREHDAVLLRRSHLFFFPQRRKSSQRCGGLFSLFVTLPYLPSP
jgi:hypothetical protein